MARADIKLTTDMDSSKLQAGLARARAGIKSFASSAMGQIAMLAGVAGFGGLAQKAIEFGSLQSDLANQLNMNTTAFQAFSGAMKSAGGNQEQAKKSVVALNASIIQAKEGLSTYVRAFDRMGISLESLEGKPVEQQMEIIAKAINNATDRQSAFTSVVEIFGRRNAPQLIEVFQRLGKDGFGKLTEDMKVAYGIMDAETQKKLDDVADKMEMFKTKTTIIFGELLVKSMPYIEMLGMGLKHLGVTFVGWFNVAKTNLEGVGKVAMAIFEPLIKQFQGFGQVLASFKDIADPKKMFEGMKKGAETYVDGVKDALDLKSTFAVIKDAVKESSDVFVEEFNKISDSGNKTFEDISNRYKQIGKDAKGAVDENQALSDALEGTNENATGSLGGGGGGTITSGGGSKKGKGGTVSRGNGRFDEADTNQSGVVTRREQKAFERKQREIERALNRLRTAEMGIETEFGDLASAEADEDPRFGTLDDPFSRGGRLAKRFRDAQADVARLDPNSPLAMGQMGALSPLNQSKQGGGADDAEEGKNEKLVEVLEQIKEFNETTDTNIGEIKDLMDKIDSALT